MGHISQVESRPTEVQEFVLVQKGKAGRCAELVKILESLPGFNPSHTTDNIPGSGFFTCDMRLTHSIVLVERLKRKSTHKAFTQSLA